MKKLKRILVAVKSPGSRRQIAVQKAAQLAAATGAEVELFHALSQPVYADPYSAQLKSLKQTQAEIRSRAEAQLRSLATPLKASGIKVSISTEWDFPVYEALVRQARRSKSDLVVAERHATRHLLPWLLRFNDWELLRRSSVPVLLVKKSQAWRRPKVLAAVDPQHVFAKASKLDQSILDAGELLASALSGQFHVVHSYPTVSGRLASADARLAESAKKSLDIALQGRRIGSRRRHLLSGHAIDVIPRLARRLPSGIVVMGAVSRSGWKRLLIGNIAEQVLDQLACDVLVIKPAPFQSKVGAKGKGARLLFVEPYI